MPKAKRSPRGTKKAPSRDAEDLPPPQWREEGLEFPISMYPYRPDVEAPTTYMMRQIWDPSQGRAIIRGIRPGEVR